MPELHLDDELFQEAVERKVEEILAPYKREAMCVSLNQLSEMTSFSRSHLERNIIEEPEVKRWQRQVNGRKIYKYPEVREGIWEVIERKNMRNNVKAI
ncbi:hypothetical protein [Marinococcus luteus]|uniref:hypothetical protein n=1 Tax=Marinococcus luteus TaxID=1122204 RepID=UPI002ACCE2A7|nr:hypothetical protein [Marinococcus luteus]MDZ5782074.1 hypothetical protein [Marinococcus luteus]